MATTTIKVDVNIKHQTIEGFGGAIAYYENWLTAHPNKEDIYDLIFTDLGLSILRLRNSFYNESIDVSNQKEIFLSGQKRLSVGLPKILLSSWSPPPELKDNGSINAGTLKKENGKFVYEKFATYWHDSIQRYVAQGIVPNYISIQNEPDMNATYDSCRFNPTEGVLPSYSQALNATYHHLRSLSTPPKMLGPEVLGIGYQNVEKYTKTMNMDQVWGLAHHLYHGGDEKNPDTFNEVFTQLSSEYSHKPKLMTEFYRGDWFDTAWIVHNSLVVENIAAYIFWDLVWGGSGNMIWMDNPWDRSSWRNKDGYTVDRRYYAFKQFSRFIQPNWSRVNATIVTQSELGTNDLRVSSFLSPHPQMHTQAQHSNQGVKEDIILNSDFSLVLLNVGTSPIDSVINVLNLGFEFSGAMYQTSNILECEKIGTYHKGDIVHLPPHSITTISTLAI